MLSLASSALDPNTINQQGLNSVWGLLTLVLNYALFAAGAVSLIMVLVGALRYILSSGNPQNTASAKNTIIYAIVGLVLTIMALILVKFVQGLFS